MPVKTSLDRARLRDTNLLDLAPRRAAPWQEVDGRVIVQRPKPQGRGLSGLSERLSYWMAPRRLRLDPLGSFVWRRLDGSTAVGEIVREFGERFGEEAEPVARLALFIRQLWREGLIAYPELDDRTLPR